MKGILLLLFLTLLTVTCHASPLPSQSSLVNSSRVGPGCYRRSNETSSVECFIRTLNHDNFPDLISKQELSSVRALRIKCSDKFLFDSFLAPNQTLFQMTFLEEVSVESCKIRSLPSNVWASLSYLRKLRISSRNGDWSTSVSLLVDNQAFQGLNQLTSLDLSQNNIWSLPETIFCPLRSLQKLNVSWNRLSELEELNPGLPEANFCSLNGVTVVDASFNQLRRVGRIVKWKKLVELQLENNFIEELQDDAFAELGSLRSVNLSSNRLVALPPSIFKFNGGSLREVYLANNSISALAPAVFSGLNGLLLLDVSRNTLTSQWIREKMFNGLVRLLALRLSFNQLSSIDEMIFSDLINLQTLNLDHNRIESVHPGAFRMTANLRVLDLSHNRLVRLDEKVFGGLGVLRQLYLDHNKIRSVEDRLLENCTNLQVKPFLFTIFCG
ncbi:unnamed protein product [Allacma fusca]|uniref:Uncharacterized protein n=1 Tax=Allacma fusca TaxID=39272 RepID=A0A8J2P808_9HEXA|nr:unnamed protein product [Allacma fusca]